MIVTALHADAVCIFAKEWHSKYGSFDPGVLGCVCRCVIRVSDIIRVTCKTLCISYMSKSLP